MRRCSIIIHYYILHASIEIFKYGNEKNLDEFLNNDFLEYRKCFVLQRYLLIPVEIFLLKLVLFSQGTKCQFHYVQEKF